MPKTKKVEEQIDAVLDLYIGGSDDFKAAQKQRIKGIVAEVEKSSRIELAKDIKNRHWANDKLRDVYLDAVIEVAKEELNDKE